MIGLNHTTEGNMRVPTESASKSRIALWLAGLALLALPASGHAAGAVYVANEGCCRFLPLDRGVSQFAIGAGGLLSPRTPATVPVDGSPHGIAVSPDGKSAYITFVDSVLEYDIDPHNGSLSPKNPASISAGVNPNGVAVSPDSESVYVTNGIGTISQYNADPRNGALSPKDPATVPAGPYPAEIAVNPDGKSAYVSNAYVNPTKGQGATVSQFSIDPQSGALSPKTPATVATGQAPHGIAVTPNGKNAYVTTFDRTVWQYTVDPTTGGLSPKTPITVPAGSNDPSIPPVSIAVTPDGTSAYVVSLGFRVNGIISQFSIDSQSGALAPKTPADLVAEPQSAQIAVTSDGKNAYVTNDHSDDPGTVSQFSIDPQNGVLSPKTPATVAGGQGPWAIAVWPVRPSPTVKDQCKGGGWHNFPQFNNQGQCVAFVEHGG